MAQSNEVMLKGFFKYYNSGSKKIFLEVHKKYIDNLKNNMRKDIKHYPFKEYKNCNTVYILNNNVVPVDVSILECKNIIIRCSYHYYEFQDKDGQIVNGYKIKALKAKEI